MRPRCKCAHRPDYAQPVMPPVTNARFRHPVSGGVLTLFGMLGWLCVPKCPLCVAAYVAIGSGVTLSFAQSQMLRQAMIFAAVGMILAGAWRLARHARRITSTHSAHY